MNNNIKMFLDESAKANFTNIKPVNNTESIGLNDFAMIAYNVYIAYLKGIEKNDVEFKYFPTALRSCGAEILIDGKPFIEYQGERYSLPLR